MKFTKYQIQVDSDVPVRLDSFPRMGGSYSVNVWVGVYRWDTETLTLPMYSLILQKNLTLY